MNRETTESLDICADASALAQEAAKRVLAIAREAVAARGIFTIALAGGSTPKRLYTLLAHEALGDFPIPWERTHCFFGDERTVSPEHEESNFRMANESLLSRVPIPASNLHRIGAEEADVDGAATRYEGEMRGVFESVDLVRDGFPRFDLILLGMGPDGHTASLFPGTSALGESQRWVVSTWVERLQTHRITVTFPVINHAAQVILMIAGADKAERIGEIFASGGNATHYPVQGIRPVAGRVSWLLDQAAAARLPAGQAGRLE